MPCCFDALSARLIEQAGFELTFMSGFAVSASRLGMPDTGLISFGEMLDQGRNICAATRLPVIGDGDTGYGNALNVKRTVTSYAAAGFAGTMIEDQEAPKRCGHTRGKRVVVSRAEALSRVRAAVDAREEGADILIMARTDARATDGLDEAVARCQGFADLGADILFLEGPRSESEMVAFCEAIPGPKMANLVEGRRHAAPAAGAPRGDRLQDRRLSADASLRRHRGECSMRFERWKTASSLTASWASSVLRGIVGFEDYDAEAERYRVEEVPIGKREVVGGRFRRADLARRSAIAGQRREADVTLRAASRGRGQRVPPPQAIETSEVAVVRVHGTGVFDGVGGNVRVRRQVGADVRRPQQVGEDRPVTAAGPQQIRVGLIQPALNSIQRVRYRQGRGEHATIRRQPHEPENAGIAEPPRPTPTRSTPSHQPRARGMERTPRVHRIDEEIDVRNDQRTGPDRRRASLSRRPSTSSSSAS